MGIFSSSYETTVGTQVYRVMEDDSIISSIKVGMINGIFSDSGQIVEHILDSMSSSVGSRVERAFNYAKKNYTFGLPFGTVQSSVDTKATVLSVLKQLINPSITIDYNKFGVLNLLHVGWTVLFNNYGYDSATNKIGTLGTTKGFPVYLKDIVVVIKAENFAQRAAGSLELWGTAAKAGYTPDRPVLLYSKLVLSPSLVLVDPTVTTDSIKVSYMWQEPKVITISEEVTQTVNGVTTVLKPKVTSTIQETKNGTLLIPITSYDQNADYIHVKYINGAKEGYWLYKINSGNVLIDDIFNKTQTTVSSFFPFIYFRHLKHSMAENKTKPEYLTSKKFLKTMGIDYDLMIDSIHINNADIDKIDQAVMLFAVPPKSTNQVEQRYLFDFFKKFHQAIGGTNINLNWDLGQLAAREDSSGDREWITSPNELMASVALKLREEVRINLSIKDSRLKTGLSCQGIFASIKVGVIGKVGTYTSAFFTEKIANTYTTTVVTENENSSSTKEVVSTVLIPIDSYIYKCQTTDSTYEEIKVYDLKFTYYMWGGYSTLGNDLDPILLIPLDQSITSKYSIVVREELYSRSLHYVFNSRVVTEVKWYQSMFIQGVLLFAALCIAIYDGGKTLAAVAAGKITVLSAVISTAIAIVKKFVFTKIFTLFVKELGADAAFVIALVAVVAGLTRKINPELLTSLPSAKDLLLLASNMVSGINGVISDAMQDLFNEANKFTKYVEENEKLIDDLENMLENTSMLSPLVIFGETPDNFYKRTLMSNPGVLGLDSVHAFVDNALTLPSINDTLGYKYA